MNSKHFTAVLTALLITGFAAPAAAASQDSSNSNNGLFVGLKATISSVVGGDKASAEANAEVSTNAGTSNAEEQHEENKGESNAFGLEFLSFLGNEEDSEEQKKMPENTRQEIRDQDNSDRQENMKEQGETQKQENSEDSGTSAEAEADSETSVEAGDTDADAGTATDSSLTVDEEVTSDEETSSDQEQQTEEQQSDTESTDNQSDTEEENSSETGTQQDDSDSEVAYEGDVGVFADPSDAGTESTHTAYITVPENHRGSSFNNIEIDYSVAGSKADVSDVGSADIKTLMVDTYSNSSTEAIDALDYKMTSASVQVKNEGHTLIVAPGSQPSYSLNTTDRVIVEYSGVTNPENQGEFNVSVEVNSQSSNSNFEPSIAELVIG